MYCFVTTGSCKTIYFTSSPFYQSNNPGNVPHVNICVDKHLLDREKKSTDVYLNVISICGNAVKGSGMKHCEEKLFNCLFFALF